jgi:hypothetical protein
MRDRNLVVLAAVVTVVAAAAEALPGLVVQRLAGDWPAALPQVGTVGETVALGITISNVVGPLVTWVLVLGLGVYAGRRVDVRREHRRLLRALGAGSVGAVLLLVLALGAVQAVTGSLTGPGAVNLLVGLLAAVLSHAVPVVGGGFAGAAIAAAERDRETERGGDHREREGTAGQESQPERVREHAVEDAG